MADLLQSTVDGVDVITAPVELDVYTAPSLREAAMNPELLARGRLVIDLTGTTFIDSNGLGVILGALKRISSAGGAMAVACTHENVRGSFRVTGMDRVLVLHDTAAEAIAAVKEVGGAV